MLRVPRSTLYTCVRLPLPANPRASQSKDQKLPPRQSRNVNKRQPSLHLFIPSPSFVCGAAGLAAGGTYPLPPDTHLMTLHVHPPRLSCHLRTSAAGAEFPCSAAPSARIGQPRSSPSCAAALLARQDPIAGREQVA